MRLLLTIILSLFACSCSGSMNDAVVAKIAGEPIYKSVFSKALRIELQKYDPQIANNPDRMNQIKKDVLESIIKDQILYSAALEAKVTADNAELAKEYAEIKSRYTETSCQKMLQFKGLNYEDWKEAKKRDYIIDKFIRQNLVSKLEIADDEIKKYYNLNRKTFSHPDEVHARQILVDDYKKAEDLRAKAAGGENFAALAQEFSIAPEAKRGGDLGWFPRGIMPKAFDEACFPLPTGQISPIVKTEFGYHIFKVMERRNAKSLPLAEVREKVLALIQQEKIKTEFDKWFEAIKARTKVEVYEKEID
ncbi:MAG: peptidyl-prolyl cis-trans isomerase [Deltaproteobacteria bacterium]|nr:peptidyl-prolyl cis-trans isomerase [Deltaproteobacteria bacterium]